MPHLDAAGTRLHYAQMGSGPDLVLVHGLAANLAFWFATGLMSLRRRFRVTVFDLRGHGHSAMPARDYTVSHLAADLNALLDGLDVRRALLIGHSYGGQIALYFACQYPERVDGLVLCDSRIPALQARQRPYATAAAQAHAGAAHWATGATHAVREPLPGIPPWVGSDPGGVQAPLSGVSEGHEPPVGMQLLECWCRQIASGATDPTALLPGARTWISQRSAQRWCRLLDTTTARADFRRDCGPPPSTLARQRYPLLGIYGQHSWCLPSAIGLRACRPDAAFNVVPKAGHFFPLTRPRALLRNLLPFIARVHGLRHATRMRPAISAPLPAPLSAPLSIQVSARSSGLADAAMAMQADDICPT